MTNGRNCEMKQRKKGKREGENKRCGRGKVDSKGGQRCQSGHTIVPRSETRGIFFSYGISNRYLISNQPTLYMIPSQAQESIQSAMNNMIYMQSSLSKPLNEMVTV